MLFNIVFQHITQGRFQRDRIREFEPSIIQILTDYDTVYALSVLWNSVVLGIQHLPIHIITVFFQFSDKFIEGFLKTAAYDIFDVFVNGESGFLFTEKPQPLNQEGRTGFINFC